jgi:predicted aspartyl protease
MRFTLKDDLPFIELVVNHRGQETTILDVIIDTGSATTILAAQAVADIGITPELQDSLHTIVGVGGSEVVFSRRVDYLQIGAKRIAGFEIEIGKMNYGFNINGILGMDFLIQAGAVIDLSALDLSFIDQV